MSQQLLLMISTGLWIIRCKSLNKLSIDCVTSWRLKLLCKSSVEIFRSFIQRGEKLKKVSSHSWKYGKCARWGFPPLEPPDKTQSIFGFHARFDFFHCKASQNEKTKQLISWNSFSVTWTWTKTWGFIPGNKTWFRFSFIFYVLYISSILNFHSTISPLFMPKAVRLAGLILILQMMTNGWMTCSSDPTLALKS